MMTLDEAIVHCEDVANDQAGCCEDCAEEHRQLAEWLKELKAYKEQTEMDGRVTRVTCITCKHQSQLIIGKKKHPDKICDAQIWEGLKTAPHVIFHDLHEPIRCDHWEPKEEGQRND